MTAAQAAGRRPAEPAEDDPEAPLRAELARLMLEGARRLLRERDGSGDAEEPSSDRKRRPRRG